jgi:hypothetical protein
MNQWKKALTYALVAIMLAGGLEVVMASQAYAGASDICAGNYIYYKGPEFSWPAAARSDICVRPWSDSSNPNATETQSTVRRPLTPVSVAGVAPRTARR